MQNRSYQVGTVRVEWGADSGGMRLRLMPQPDAARKERTEGMNLIMGDSETCRELEKIFQNERPDWNKVVDILEKNDGMSYGDAAGILARQLAAQQKIKNIDLELDEIVMFDRAPKKSSRNIWATLFCCCGESRANTNKQGYLALDVDFDNDDNKAFEL